jgi:cytochrome c biogenesis protein
MKIKILRILADLKFAISLLIIIIIVITLGSVIEQDKPLEFYQQNYPENKLVFGLLNWKIIQKIGIDHLYKTIWFISLLIIFGVSLITCTVFQQFPIVKFSKRCNFNLLKNSNITTSLNYLNNGKFLTKIICSGYFSYQQKMNLYSIKGILGRISPIFVHISIIIILFGSILSAFTGFNVQELIPKSEIVHIQNVINSGPLTKISQQAIRLNDFWISYYSNNNIKQFYSNISILDNRGSEIVNKTISVNKPLVYNDLTFYQTDWTFVGIRLKENNKSFQLPFLFSQKLNKKLFVTWLPINRNEKIKKLQQSFFFGKTIIIKNYKEFISIYDLSETLETNNDIYEFILNNNYKTIDFIVSSGLQIKLDPGVLFIYCGFGFLMLSSLLSYLSFSQIFVLKNFEKKNLILYAKTNRDKYLLKLEIFNILK